MITYQRLSFVYVLLCHLLCMSKCQNDRILLNDVTSITLREGEYITSKKLKPIPQLVCVSGSVCKKYPLKLVNCYNKGFDGLQVFWNCKAQMSKDITFGKINVSCESYDNLNNSYILLNSCALKYELEYTTCGNKKKLENSSSNLFLRTEIVIGVVAFVVANIIYGIMSTPFEGNSKDRHCDLHEEQRKKRITKEKVFDESNVKKTRKSNGWFSTFINYFFKKNNNEGENSKKNSTQASSFSFFSKNKSFDTSSIKRVSLSNLPYDNQKVVDFVWNSSPEEFPLEKICVEEFGIAIYRRDLIKLRSGDWINDELINFFMELIVDRSKRINMLPKIFAFNSFFYGTYTDKGYEGVKKWTKSVDIFAYEIVLIPLHMGAHWCLAVIDFVSKAVEYYDSMLKDGTQCLLNLRNYLAEEYFEKKGKVLDVSAYSLKNKKEIPTQKKGYDCGIFLCRFADCASLRRPMNFSAESMDDFRAQMTYEIYTAKLLS